MSQLDESVSNNSSANTEKFMWANNLRAFSTIAVIMLHVASTISAEYPSIRPSYFITSIFLDSSVRWCVPVFIMLSGSFALENYDNNMKAFLLKMFWRIIVPFIFWSIVYLFFFSADELIASPGIGKLLSFVGKQFLTGTASHLWFVYVIISMYITFPFLSKWTKSATEKEYGLFIMIWLIFLVADPLLAPYDINFSYTFFTGFIGYIVLGNYLFKTQRTYNLWLIIAGFTIAFLYTALRTYFLSSHKNETDEYFMDNLSLNVFVMSFCVYVFFKSVTIFNHPILQKIISLICKYSYGIYLSHLLVLNIFLKLGLSFYFTHPLLSIPVITLACVVISLGLLMLMKKIPGLKLVAG